MTSRGEGAELDGVVGVVVGVQGATGGFDGERERGGGGRRRRRQKTTERVT